MEKQKISIQPIQTKTVELVVRGEALLMNKQSEAVKETLRSYQNYTKKPKGKERISEKDLLKSKTHFTASGQVGFPAVAFKKAMVNVASQFGLFKKQVNGNIFILGDVIPIKFRKQTVSKIWGKIQGRRPVEIVRPQFNDWSAKLLIKFNADALNIEQLVALLNWSGFANGVGDFRPERGGSFGQFQVVAK